MWSTITSSLSGTDVFTIMSSKFGSLPFVAFRSSLISICRRSIVSEVLAGCRTSALEKIDHLLVIENNSPNTVHESEYMEYSEKYLTWYRNARTPLLIRGAPHWQQLKPEELAALDPYSQALLYMANTRAYFRGSYRSFFPHLLVWGADQQISRIQEIRGYGSIDDRSRTIARVGLEARSQFCIDEGSRYYWARQSGKSKGILAGAAGR
jgi:hypothetical protein